jgi:hypothetical protein
MNEKRTNLEAPMLEKEVARYLATGESDPLGCAFPGNHTLAFACEAYSRILERPRGKAERHALLRDYARSSNLPYDTVDRAELLDILTDAVESRNGWRRILARCSPPR